jgi:hypothetical protein
MWTAADVWVRVEGVAVVADFAIERVESAGRGLVDEVVPLSVEGHGWAMIDVDQQGFERLLAEYGQRGACQNDRSQACEAGKRETNHIPPESFWLSVNGAEAD